MLFRTGAKGFAAHVPRDATPIFFPEKENGRRPPKRKAFALQASSSKSCNACRCYFLRAALPRLGLLDDLTFSYYPLLLC